MSKKSLIVPGDDREEASSSECDKETLIANFRQEWKKELQFRKQNLKADPVRKNAPKKEEETDECKARNLFLKGIEMERSGLVYEAIQFYRRAVQIVPDIEFHLEESFKQKTWGDVEEIAEDIKSMKFNADEKEISDNADSDDETNYLNFSQKIQKKLSKSDYFCLPKIEQKDMHISALPMEILLYILRWVVSADLDLRSLEMFSQTCRWFYLCARDQEIWRSACERQWGLNCGNLSGTYGSWRDMFIERVKVQFNGCYISKTTYIRQGESSFQDQFYRPWHLISYYRYLRFFPEGIVLMLTTPDEPSQCVSLLKYRQARAPTVLSGHYRLKDDVVTIVVQRQEGKLLKRGRRKDNTPNNQQTFHLELKIQSQPKRRHAQLVWKRYSVYTQQNETENNCTFDLIGNNFPPLWFSRVKSYTSDSEEPLQ